jgi:DNA-binding FadR family transcriptional regulator
MKKERVVIERILDLINADDVQIGSALPSERKLASQFGTSRNTIRNALRQLEARGFVDVRRGSGYYLLCKDDRFQPGTMDAETRTLSELQSLFEARYLFEPPIGALSARRISAPLLTELEKCLVRLSRAIIGARSEAIASEDIEFRKIIASGTGNRVMVAAIHQLRATNHQALTIFPEFNDRERDTLFAEYVDILNSLKKHDAEATEALMQTNILRCCALVMKYAGIDMPELIVAAMHRRETALQLPGGVPAVKNSFRTNNHKLQSKRGGGMV